MALETDGLCNWGIATGEGSGVWVLDIDPRHGGDKTLAQLEAQHGPLPLTPTVGTGGGGKQFYFTPCRGENPQQGQNPAGAGYPWRRRLCCGPALAPCSGHRYAWLAPMDTPLAEAPAWLLALVRGDTPQAESQCRVHQPSTSTNAGPGNGLTLTLSPNAADLTNSPGVGEGSRNATLCRYAGVHIARGENWSRPSQRHWRGRRSAIRHCRRARPWTRAPALGEH